MRVRYRTAGQRTLWLGSAWFLGVVLVSCALLLTLWVVRADTGVAQEVHGSLGGVTGGQRSVASGLWSAAIEAGGGVSHTVYLPAIFGMPESLPFGVQVNHIEPRTTVSAASAGADWVRVRLFWDAIEPTNTTPENYRWSPGLEQELASYAASGVQVVLTLMGNPEWAATYPAGPIDRVDIGELVQFMRAVVERYGAPPYDVKHWEMYNEPDNADPNRAKTGWWGYFGDNPQAYVDLLEAIYQPVKAVDAGAQVVFGGMAYDNWEPPDGSGPFVKTFLDDVLAIMDDRNSYPFDVMNFHYYPNYGPIWSEYGIDIIGKANFIRDKMVAYGADKPLICTETSMWSNCLDEEVEVLCGSDEKQSRYVVQVNTRSQAAGLDFTIWFMLYDSADLATKYGLLDEAYAPKPSHQAYLTLGSQLLGTGYSRTLEVSETGSDQIEAYEFLQRDGIHRVVVAWSNDDLAYTMRLPGASLIRVGKYGDQAVIYDGDDGQPDGNVTVIIGPSPVYLRLGQ